MKRYEFKVSLEVLNDFIGPDLYWTPKPMNEVCHAAL